MKKYKKSNKGITLVALVITIIILLILAGLSISALTGSGLFGKAEEAVNRYGNAQNRENSILGEYENYINDLSKDNPDDETEEDLIHFWINDVSYTALRNSSWVDWIDEQGRI